MTVLAVLVTVLALLSPYSHSANYPVTVFLLYRLYCPCSLFVAPSNSVCVPVANPQFTPIHALCAQCPSTVEEATVTLQLLRDLTAATGYLDTKDYQGNNTPLLLSCCCLSHTASLSLSLSLSVFHRMCVPLSVSLSSKGPLVKHNPHLMWCDVWVWASALQPHTIIHPHTLTITCTSRCDEIKGIQDQDLFSCSFSDSFSLSCAQATLRYCWQLNLGFWSHAMS